MIDCPQCSQELAATAVSQSLTTCPSCRVTLEVDLYPALLRPPESSPGQPVQAADDASCYFHEENLAESACDRCGRFICPVCEFRFDDGRLCSACLDTEYREPSERLVIERTLWDRIVLSLAVLPMILFYVTLFTAPIALFLGFRNRKSPRSLVHSSGWRLYLGSGLAALQVLGWAVLFLFLIWLFIESQLG